jgi:elongator complex protein 1
MLHVSSLLASTIHQGARLVAAPAGGCQAILQMPRGNLETVSPRLLVLAAILGHLRAGSYQVAWKLAGSQRVDLNVLVDDRWPSFLDQAPAFVQVGLAGSRAHPPRFLCGHDGDVAKYLQLLCWACQLHTIC